MLVKKAVRWTSGIIMPFAETDSWSPNLSLWSKGAKWMWFGCDNKASIGKERAHTIDRKEFSLGHCAWHVQ